MYASQTIDMGEAATGALLQFGALGVFAMVSLYFFLLVYRREVARADKAEAALAVLNSDVREKVIPALTDTVHVNTELRELLRELRRRDAGP